MIIAQLFTFMIARSFALVFAQALTDLPVVQKLTERLDLVGLLIGLGFCIHRRILVPGYILEAAERREAELKKVNDRLVEAQLQAMELAVSVRRNP